MVKQKLGTTVCLTKYLESKIKKLYPLVNLIVVLSVLGDVYLPAPIILKEDIVTSKKSPICI